MTELKLFTTPAEEMDLSLLRERTTRIYHNAFKRIHVELLDKLEPHHNDLARRVLDICIEAKAEADALAAAHIEKWKGK